MKRLKILVAAIIGLVPLAVAAPAHAACVGSQATIYTCATVDPDGGEPIEDCIYLAGDQCQQVSIPVPAVSTTCGGQWGWC